jgi:hypothetical protein
VKFLFNFKRQFVPAVESGEKLRTIRRNRNDGKRPVPGDIACLYTGLRTRSTRLLREAKVLRCLAVRIDFEDYSIVVDGHKLDHTERGEFARADGFPNVVEMLTFFKEQYGGPVFEGFLTEWAAP